MSGGSHNYICYKIEEELCGQMDDRELNDLMEDIAKLSHDLEWYHSSDISHESYVKTVKAFKKKWFGSDRQDRLRGYINEAIAKLKDELYALLGDVKNG